MQARYLLIALALALPFAAIAQKPSPEPLTVFAAASLKESLDACAAQYQRATGQTLRVSYGATSALARQIEQGAPADVFLSADEEWMDYLQQRKLIDTSTRRDLLGNTLVLIAPNTAAPTAVKLERGVDLLPRLGANGRIAVALTASVPAGKYAKAAFESLGVWPQLQPRLAETENVRAALMLVARGEALLGVVYGSDARAEPTVRVLATFPVKTHPPIVYPVARIATSRHPGGMAFVRWLKTPAAAAIFRKYGFSLR